MIDLKPPREIKHPDVKAVRDQLRLEKRCINGPRDPDRVVGKRHGVVHGEVYRGGRCKRCWDVAHPKTPS